MPRFFLSDAAIDRILFRSSTGSDLRTLVLGMAKQNASILKAKFRDRVSIEIVDERGTSQNTDAKRREARQVVGKDDRIQVR